MTGQFRHVSDGIEMKKTKDLTVTEKRGGMGRDGTALTGLEGGKTRTER